ncbi:MAG: IS30 family transposase [Kiritimatiellaeota bacterium]|nr:IS30 family transposase [Kiritimatiellota bacterium]
MILQTLWNDNANRGAETQRSIHAFAEENGMPYATLRRELLRGMDGKTFFDKIKKKWFYPEYSAEKAQADADEKNAQKGTPQRFTNKIAKALRHHIVELGKSPAHARHDLIVEGYENLPCLSSIYNHIEHGDIGILRGQTPYHPKGKRKRKPTVQKAKKCPANLSIEDRPKEAAERAEFGHYEMDTIVSCVGGKGGVLILTERKTRRMFAVKLPAITAKAVRNALRGLIRGGVLKHVRSITTDNGAEFLDAKALEHLFKDIQKTLRIYYTHAYAAWEKGSVENVNRHVRRFFPKGTDFRRVPPRAIAAMQDFINSIPRKHSLKGLTAHEAFCAAA